MELVVDTLASNKQWCASTCSEAVLRNDDLRFQWCFVAAAIEQIAAAKNSGPVVCHCTWICICNFLPTNVHV